MLTGWGLLSAQRQESEEARVVVGHIRQLQVRRGEESEGRSCSQVMESFACWLDEFEPHCTGSEELWIAFELRAVWRRLRAEQNDCWSRARLGQLRGWRGCSRPSPSLCPQHHGCHGCAPRFSAVAGPQPGLETRIVDNIRLI